MTGKLSRLGAYEGYARPCANGYVRRSRYLTMDDGCRIAIDILRPAQGGTELTGRLPTIVHATGYRRAYLFGESDRALVGEQPSWKRLALGDLVTAYEKTHLAKCLIDHGYTIVAVDLRGTGASFGATHAEMWRNSADVARIIDWIAEQDWATDKVGMIGISWEATIQLTTAAYQPKHLTAIAPMATSTGFSAFCDNGLVLHGFYNVDWMEMRRAQETQAPSLPVDGDRGSRLRDEAVAGRATPETAYGDDPLVAMRVTRDAMLPALRHNAPPPPMPEAGPLNDSLDEVARINASGTAIMLVSGWWDISFSGHVLDFFRALTVPKRLLMGPWQHLGPNASWIEQHRWFDHWLKGVPNGIMDEPAFQFAVSDAYGDERWHEAPAYPLPETRARIHWLTTAGALGPEPDRARSSVAYPVDYSVTLGTHSRSRFFFRPDKRVIPPDLNARAAKCVAFTSPAFPDGAEINGRPELWLYLRTTADSGAVVVTLEELMDGGDAVYITEGNLNFFHRRVSDSPRPHDGRGFHAQNAADLLPVQPNATMELAIELYPVAWRVSPGSRLRLTVAGADADNLLVVPLDPRPTLSIETGGEPASRLYLPLVDKTVTASARPMPAPDFGGPNARVFAYLARRTLRNDPKALSRSRERVG